MENLTIQTDDISSTQQWTSDPQLLEVYIEPEFLAEAEEALVRMKDSGMSHVQFDDKFAYQFFDPDERELSEMDNNLEVTTDAEGERFIEAEPEYQVDGCNARVYRDGSIKVIFPFKHTDDRLTANITSVAELRKKMTEAGLLVDPASTKGEEPTVPADCIKKPELIAVTLDNGDVALFVNGDAVLQLDSTDAGECPSAIGEHLAKALNVELQQVSMDVPDDDDWSWNDVYELLPPAVAA